MKISKTVRTTATLLAAGLFAACTAGKDASSPAPSSTAAKPKVSTNAPTTASPVAPSGQTGPVDSVEITVSRPVKTVFSNEASARSSNLYDSLSTITTAHVTEKMGVRVYEMRNAAGTVLLVIHATAPAFTDAAVIAGNMTGTATITESAVDHTTVIDTMLTGQSEIIFTLLAPDAAAAAPSSDQSQTQTQAPAPTKQEVDQPKQDLPKQDQPKQDLPKQDQPKQDLPKQDQPKQDLPKQDQPKQDLPKQDQPKQDLPKQDQPKADLPKQDQPKQDLPKQDQPKADLPKQDQPKADLPKQDQPKADLPKQDQPKADLPKQDQPKADLPKQDQPKQDLPKQDQPKTDLPKQDQPKPEAKK